MNARKDELTAGYIQVGLIYKQMLGIKEAENYLRSVGVAAHVIHRVLWTNDYRHMQLVGNAKGGSGARG